MDISKSFLKKLLTSILFITTFGFATVTIDGYAYVENLSDHSGITVTFERTAPSALTETATTDATGYFTAALETGIYNVAYTKDGYFSEFLTDQSFFTNSTLSSLTLLEHTTLINVPSLFSTIQTAINYAFNGDTVLVQPGTYVENINYNGKNIVVGSLYLTTQDTSYISSTIIDGNQNGSVVSFTSTGELCGITITNGLNSSGGGINCNGGSPSINNVIISGNSASDRGGGIYCAVGTSLLINNVRITSNSASNQGGGIYCWSSNLTINNTTISDNSGSGGGMYCNYSTLNAENVNFINNSGCAIMYSYSGGNLINSVIKYNSAGSHNYFSGIAGGGILLWHSSPSLTNVVIIENSSSDKGGGIYCAESDPILINVTITNNSATNNGGGLYVDYSSVPSLVNSIVSNNSGNYGIYVHSGSPSITYSNFYDNENGNFYNVGDWIGVNVTTNANGDSVDVYYNIQEDPLFVDAANGDYNLQQGSPCIDAGDPTSPYDPDGSIADMGALPSAYGTPVPIVINVPTDYSTIQAALTAAGTSDTVLVQPGTYTENIFWPETNGIKLISAGDSSNTIIDGGGVSSVIYMNPQSATIDTTTLIQGFKITNGGNENISSGGGLLIKNAGMNIVECSIDDNISNEKGGGIYVEQSNLNIYRSNITSNRSVFQNEYYNGGGGIHIACSSVKFIGVAVNNNRAENYKAGGGIFCSEGEPPDQCDSYLTIINSSVSNNYAAENAGGLYIDQTNIIFTNVDINGNTAAEYAGGLYLHGLYGSRSIQFNGITNIRNNNAKRGAGVVTHGSSLIGNINIINNTATETGGGIRAQGQDVVIRHAKIIGNTAANGGSINVAGMYDYGVTIDSTVIASNISVGGSTINASNNDDSIDISNSVIVNNNSSNAGILNTSGNGDINISNSTLYNNSSQGMYKGMILGSGSSLNMTTTNIYNDGNSVQNNESMNIAATTNNYWGHSSGPYHSSQNPSGQGDSVSFFVNVDPWLTEPNTDAPPIPAQNVTVNSTGNDFISLSWNASEMSDLAGYKLYYDFDSSGYPYANSIDIGTETSYTLSSLPLGTTYYLAVTTYDTDGNESWYSNEVIGVTRVIQAQSIDIGGDEDLQHLITHTPSITFGYYDSMNETQTSYQVQVSTHSDYSSADMWDSDEITSSDTSVTYDGATLEDGVTYYLRAKVGAGTFYSDWSNLTFRMNTEPTTPVLVSPINDQVTATPVVLNVFNAIDAESDVVTYSFNVYDDATLVTKLDSATALTEGNDTTSWQVTATLPDNGQYFWAVSTNDGYEESTVSTAASFLLNISNDAPAAFALTYPTDTSEVTTTLPTLIWNISSDPDPLDTVRYIVQFGSTIPNLETFYTDTLTSYQFTTELEDNTDYFWRVIAEDLNGASTENNGGYLSFRVNTANDLPGDFALISPDDQSIVTDLTPTLYWEVPVDPDDRSRSIVSYHVYLDTSLTGTILDTVSTNSYTASNLLEDAMYYWKIVAVDDDGGTKESSIWSFWTNSENSSPTAITLLTPTVDEETGLTPTFSWTASSDTDLYDVLGYTLSYGSDPTSLTDVSTNSELTYTPETDLMDNTGYVWQVTATDQSGATYTTALQSFTVNNANDDPQEFGLISPDSGSIITEVPLLLVWTPTTDLDGDSVLFDIQLNGTSIGMTHHNYYFVDGLAEDMNYTWSVTAMDNNGGSTQSGTWSFIVNTENVPPTPFALLSPETETVFSTQSVFFEWEISTDPDPMDSVTYGLDVHTDTTHMHFEINTTSFTSEAFMDNRVYHWSVTAHDMNGGVTENTGGPRMFVINVENDPPTASTLVAPLNESIQTDLTPNFYWTPSIDPDPMDHISYTMNWWPMGVLPVIYSADTDSNSFTPEENLTDNSQFGWMVTANDIHGAESSSDSSYFYTDAFPEPPLNFATVTPENNAEGIATEVEFIWEQTDDPDPVEEIQYQLVYATDWADSSTYVFSRLLEDTSLTVSLEDNSQYYWIVVAMDTDGFMVGSNNNMPNTMVVGTLSIDGADIPEVFALHQNYPNPFNPTTQIRYDLPEDALVTINIYDLMGRSIKSLVNSNQSAGYRSIQWNATNYLGEPVSAGMYLYTIQAGKFRQTKKIVLLK